ncbi:tetratricopeptide repeat protein [Sedimenticola selenatireducens]|uniref:Sel1 repeat family protein n=1 Tax=Sedimenticola selenatireducens TaxID=191960 RepID=A0A558DTZ9_9GAMM|nr:hypothetical protein [Sedimenticola selenatireducens]TVO77088.1 hypothetical protein FHP88_06615 [Sedimenticola selenatireducens]TVT64531.1 MAG: hypothetical protein FHK78_09860 [Sedimenticola selenatireducens]
MKRFIFVLALFMYSPYSISSECDDKMAEYLDFAEKSPSDALEKYLANSDTCENRDVLAGTLYVMSGDLISGEKHYNKSIAEGKALAFAYWQLAGLELSRRNLQKVIDYCQESLKIEKHFMCYRHSGIALSLAGEHSLVPDYFGAAHQLNPNIFSDTDFMAYLAYSYTELGKYELAKGSITLAIKHNENAKQNAVFVDAYKNWKSKSGQ